MMIAKKLPSLTLSIRLTISLFALFAITFAAYVFFEKKIDHVNELRHQSFLLANEFRQVSNELTRMARNYVVTGDPIYQYYYHEIIAIRDGKKPRPKNYYPSFWDLWITSSNAAQISTEAPAALLTLMQRAEFTDQELNIFAEAKHKSDSLNNTEFAAMAMMENSRSDVESKHATALNMLFGEEYNQAKANIMQPINTLLNAVDTRTQHAVQRAKYIVILMRLTFVGFSLCLLLMLLHIHKLLRTIMGGSINDIYTQIARMGKGDFSSPIPIEPSNKNSILRWLGETQRNLTTLQQERLTAKAAQQDSDIRYQTLSDISTAGIWHIDTAGNTLYINHSMCKLLEIDNAEALHGKTFHTFFPPTSLERMRHEHKKRTQGEASIYEVELITNRGNKLDVMISGAPLRDKNGKLSGLLGTFHDITERKQTELALRESALHTQTILENMLDGVITIDEHGLIDSFNKSACAIFGYTVDEVLGHNVSMLMPEPHHSLHDQYLEHHLATGETHILGKLREVTGLRKDGSLFSMSLSTSKITRKGKTTFIGLVRDISQQRKDQEEIYRLAFYDPLTLLPNRRLLFDRLTQAMITSSRTDQHGALMFLDLDHFKLLNDNLGHDLGDVLLQQVAARLHTCVREGDSVARMGGDEFVLLLEALSIYPNEAATQAEAIAQKVIAALGQPYSLREHAYVITPSIGIVMFLHQTETMEELLKKADLAMYQAKTAGRNTAHFFDSAMQAAASVRVALEKSMREGLELKEFTLHYQLQVNAQSIPTGVEALTRWNHRTYGMIPPASFIPLAEETGMILPLGKWVLETACAQLVKWAKNPERKHWTMAVNVSVLQFSQPDFVASIDKALQKTGAHPHLLKLELTESMLLKDVDEVIIKMFEVKALGVTFSLDDFGTGYSSLSYLKRLPLDQLKIDQSFVRDLMTDPNDAVIANTIVTLGHSLGINVIAEGVETAEQRNALAKMGCDAYQGYYFARPVAVKDLTTAISKIPALPPLASTSLRKHNK